MARIVRRPVEFVTLGVLWILVAGCGPAKPSPAPDKATVDQEVKQLNDIRQKESGKK
jgi:hypothetical protein